MASFILIEGGYNDARGFTRNLQGPHSLFRVVRSVVGAVKDIKVGDIVHVRGHVYDFAHQRALLDFNMDDKCDMAWVPSSAIIHVEPRPIKVGDRVRWSIDNASGTVLAIDGGDAWISWGDDCRSTVPKGQLTLTGEPF